MNDWNERGPTVGVAHCLREYPVLSETFVYQYIRNHGLFRPIVLAQRDNGALPNFSPPCNDIYFFADYRRRWTWQWFLGRIDARLLHRPPYVLAAGRIIRRHKVRLIHAHFGPTGVWAMPLKEHLGLPLVTTFYGFDMSRLAREERWREAYQKLFEHGDLFLAEGPHMRQRLIELGCPPEKICIQRIAISLDQFSFQRRHVREDGNVRLLLCGRFVEKKGIKYAIQAVSRVRQVYPEVELRIIGDGPLRLEIERLIQELGLGGNVVLLGYRSYEEYMQEMCRADILVAPSVTAVDGDSEGGAPTVLLEAQASGLPVLSTYHADIPNVTVDRKSGFLVPERDVDALAKCLVNLIAHPEVREEMGSMGRKHIEENHDVLVEIHGLEQMYRQLLAKHG